MLSLPIESAKPVVSTTKTWFCECFQYPYFIFVSVVTESMLAPTENISYIPNKELPRELFPAPVEPIITTFESII